MAGGRMLALNEGFGYRPLLSVQDVVFVPQKDARRPTTIIYGVQLLHHADVPTMFVAFFRDKFNTPLVWDQMRVIENETEEQILAIWPRMPLAKVAEETLTLVAAGKDPVRGYFMQFDGGPIKLFSQHDWYVNHDEYGES